MTNNLIVTILASSVMASFAGIVLYFTRPLINRYCSKRLQYYIWLIMAIRLLMPFGVSIPVRNDLFSQSAAESEVVSNYEMGEIDISAGVENIQEYAELSKVPKIPQMPQMPNITLTPYDICLGIIFGVAIILLVGRVTVYLKFKRLLMLGAKPVNDDIILDQFDFIKEKMGINRAVRLLVHDVIGSPMLIGIIRPTIVLPSVLLDSDAKVNLGYVFFHELTHYKNKDIIYKWLLQCVMCFHWFNPLAYLICSECNRLCELCCDEAVTQKLSHSEKRTYGDTLLRSMELADAYAYPTVALTLAENAKLLKERLGEIVNNTRKSRVATALSVMFACVIIFSTLITGVYAATPLLQDTATVKDYTASSDANSSKIFNIDLLSLESSTNGLVFINLGKRTLTKGQRLLAEVNWEGGGALMLLYSKEKFEAASVNKLIENGSLQLDISDKTDLRINMVSSNPTLNFAMNKKGYIGWINEIPDSGEHYFYLIGLNEAAIKNVKGFIDPEHNLKAGDKLPAKTKWSGSLGEVEKNGAIEVNADSYTGDKINYEFIAKKGDSKTISLDSYLVGSYEIVFATDDRTVIKAIPAFSKSENVTLDNLPEGRVSMRLIGYNVSGSLVVKPTQVLLVAQESGIICEGGIAAGLTGPATSGSLTVNKGNKIKVSLVEDLSGLGLVKEPIEVTVIIDDQSVVLSNTDREKTIIANKSGTITAKIKNSNMQLVNYKFKLSIGE